MPLSYPFSLPPPPPQYWHPTKLLVPPPPLPPKFVGYAGSALPPPILQPLHKRFFSTVSPLFATSYSMSYSNKGCHRLFFIQRVPSPVLYLGRFRRQAGVGPWWSCHIKVESPEWCYFRHLEATTGEVHHLAWSRLSLLATVAPPPPLGSHTQQDWRKTSHDKRGTRVLSSQEVPRPATPGALRCPRGHIIQSFLRLATVGAPGSWWSFRGSLRAFPLSPLGGNHRESPLSSHGSQQQLLLLFEFLLAIVTKFHPLFHSCHPLPVCLPWHSTTSHFNLPQSVPLPL